MTDIMIAVAVDFTGGEWFLPDAGRMAMSLLPGKAGDVRQAAAPGARLMARSATAPSGRRGPRVISVDLPPGPDGSRTLLAGHLWEHDRLRAELDSVPAGAGDAELYAAAFRRYGEDCDSRITGDYAAIQWFPENRRLRLARSAASSHPLHVWRDGARLVVSSIPRTILATGVEGRVDDRTLTDMLLLNTGDGAASFYEGLSRVATATVAIHDPAGASARTYWSIGDVPPVRFQRDEDYVEALDALFRRATAACMEGVKAPAIQLSGGLDSQAVASYVMEAMGPDGKLRSYTAVTRPEWPDRVGTRTFTDESPYVRALAAMYPQLEPVFVDAAERSYGDALDAMFLLNGWPPYNEMAMHWLHESTAQAARDGCDVLLTGEGGNEAFSYGGQAAPADWFRKGQWRRLLREVRLMKDGKPFWRRLVSHAIWPHAPRSWRKTRARFNPWHVAPFRTWAPVREDYAVESGAMARAIRAGADPEFRETTRSSDFREKWFLHGQGNHAEICLGMQLMHGIESRAPTSFVPLMEFCAGIPDEQFLRDGETRWLARRLLAGRVPEMVRTERRFGVQNADWPLRIEPEREALLAEVEAMRKDGRMARIFDLERLAADLRVMPDKSDPRAFAFYRLAQGVGIGVSYARFVRYVEGRNAG